CQQYGNWPLYSF
nr:immunoglobulin light chain junction region [Macaca mulatta]MOX87508.1 immunoglobulin light chain junction region [Macaca mulatta]MOX89439.1 immunoglobulin light chain junction region [Macaca mulatta]